MQIDVDFSQADKISNKSFDLNQEDDQISKQ
jgi:hypothetical protein